MARRAAALARAGDYAAAAAVLDDGLAAHPTSWPLHYDLACYDCALGRRAAALEHLERAGELEPSVRELAAADRDLGPLHAEPDFARIVSGS